MKRIIQTIQCLCMLACSNIWGQTNTGSAYVGFVSYSTSTGTGNPTTNNNNGLSASTISTETDAATSGWTAMFFPSMTTTANKWSTTTGAIPFEFYFYGEQVTGFKVAYNGLLTFNTTTTTNPPTGDNASIPSTSIPDKTIGFWDYYWLKGTFANDKVYYKITGSTPNRQLWIKWWAVDLGSTAASRSPDNYFSFVLEETSNNIYFVDMVKSALKPLTATLGIQYNSSCYSMYSSSLALASASTTTNKYYKFAYAETAVSFEDTLSYNHSEIELATSEGYLELPHPECVTSTLNSAYLDVLVDLGSDFALGDAIINTTSLSITLTGYSASSCTAVFGPEIHTITMNSAINEVEKLTRIDLNPYTTGTEEVEYEGLDYIEVSVARNGTDNSPTTNTITGTGLRVKAWVETDFSYDVTSGDYTTASMIDLDSPTESDNVVNFSWTTECENTGHYQLQVLRIYNLNESNTNRYYVYNNEIDWDKALSIEVEDATSVSLYMGEGTGYYAWRVRPIGNVHENGIADSRNWGVWSSHALVDPVDDGRIGDFAHDEYPEIGYYEENSIFGLPDYIFYCTHSEGDKNWIYNRSFSENNSIAQGISYANGLGQLKQSQRKLQEVDSVLMSQTVYDYAGRPAIQSMTAPVNQQQLAYYNNLLLDNEEVVDGNTLYGPEDFDSAERTQFADDIGDVPIWENPLPMAGPISDYYSDANLDLRIPNANNYPFSRTLYHQEGRVKKQSLFGDEHRMGLYDKTYIDGGMQRTIRTYYSAVADSELLKVFGNQTPYDSCVYKIVRVDPNEIPTVEYKTIDGQTIATAFINTGDHPLLSDITADPTILTTKVIKGNSYPDPHTIVREQSIAFVEPTMIVDLYYSFNIKEFAGECLEYCSTCDYTIYLYIVREETDEIKWDETISISNRACDGSLIEVRSSFPEGGTLENGTPLTLLNSPRDEESSIMLSDPGVYRFGRRITVNNKKEGEQTYADYHGEQIGDRMDTEVLTRFDEFKAYLNGTRVDETTGEIVAPNLDDLNEYLDELAGISTDVVTTVPIRSGHPFFASTDEVTTDAVTAVPLRGDHPFFASTVGDEVTVSYDEYRDEYTLETNCCTAVIPKVTCDEDLCDDLWVLEMPGSGEPLVEGQTYTTADQEWEQRLISGYGGYYDFESMLYDADIDPSYNLEHLYQFFYDQYGSLIYPMNASTTATITIEHEDADDDRIEMSSSKAFIWSYESEGYMPGLDVDIITIRLTVNGSIHTTTFTLPYENSATYSNNSGDGGAHAAPLDYFYCSLGEATDEIVIAINRLIDESDLGSIEATQNSTGFITLTADDLQDVYLTVSSTENFTSYSDFTSTTATATGDFIYGDGALNCMLNHMINEETNPYSCTDILRAMEQFIDDWPTLYVTKGAPGYIGTNFLDYFLQLCGGKQYSGFSVNEYGTATTGTNALYYDKSIDGISYGYLEYAYKSFPFNCETVTTNGYTNLSPTTTQETCLRKYGVSLTEEIEDWSNPIDDEYTDANGNGAYDSSEEGADGIEDNDSLMWNVDTCGAAWWEFNGPMRMTKIGIADDRDEALQCKAWEQLYVCLQTDLESDQSIIGLSGYNPLAPTSFIASMKASYIGKMKGIAVMRDAAIRNQITRNGISLTDATSLAIASDNVIDKVINRYALDVSMLESSDRTTLFTNIKNMQKIVYGDIDVQDNSTTSTTSTASTTSTENSDEDYTPMEGFSITKAAFVASCMNDSLDYYEDLGITPETADLENWLTNIGSRFSIDLPAITPPPPSMSSTTPTATASFTSTDGTVELRASSTDVSFEYVRFADNTTYTIPAMEYKVSDRTRPDIARLRGLSAPDCNQDNIDYLLYKLEAELANCKQDEIDAVLSHYNSTCTLPSQIEDTLMIQYGVDYVNFTLFYYDVSGNLIKVVPPKGVDMVEDVYPVNGRLDSRPSRKDAKAHSYLTEYKYNSLGQRTYEITPDGGEKEFWYNSVGQIRFSQNAQQQTDGNYAYLKYDDLGRLIESGLSTKDVTDQAFANEVDDRNFPRVALSERTVSVYDEEVSELSYMPEEADATANDLTQTYLQNRISYAYSDADGTDDAGAGDEIYTYYSYDPHGNVAWMLQDIPNMNKKYIEYEYDLVSGKITRVNYNEGMNDQFFYKYNYDSDNRISSVQTSKDAYLWDTDASYEYYAYGPLKRMSMGEDHIQGLDYVYTINGWLKGVNHQALSSTYDPGGDGSTSSATAKDVFGMSLGYFDGDFKRGYDNNNDGSLDRYSPFNSDFYTEAGSQSAYYNTGINQHDWNTENCANNEKSDGETIVAANQVNYRPLYNGTITNFNYQQTKVTGTATAPWVNGRPLSFMYNYDELYRLTQANFDYYNTTAANWYRNTLATTTAYTGYKTSYTYDENGNISTLNRYSSNNVQFDALTYNYTNGTNKLSHISDTKLASLLATDIDNQPSTFISPNYTYDEIGQLIGDRKETISDIDWTAQGKVARVSYTSGKHINFLYDALGNRVAKKVYASSSDATPDVSNYVYDANGKVMGIYENTSDGSADYDLTEMPIYANSRLGMYKPTAKVDDEATYTDVESYTRTVGEKRYEISDYLGNVREVVTDIKEPASTGGYTAKVVVSNDYYPYGMMLPGRNEGETTYRYGYQGKEHDDEIKSNANSYDFGARMYDPRVGRWLSRDPLEGKQPAWSPYKAFYDNPVNWIDPTGMAETKPLPTEEDIAKILCDDFIPLCPLARALKKGEPLESAKEYVCETPVIGEGCEVVEGIDHLVEEGSEMRDGVESIRRQESGEDVWDEELKAWVPAECKQPRPRKPEEPGESIDDTKFSPTPTPTGKKYNYTYGSGEFNRKPQVEGEFNPQEREVPLQRGNVELGGFSGFEQNDPNGAINQERQQRVNNPGNLDDYE